MSIIASNKEAKRIAFDNYCAIRAKLRTEEHHAMNKMLGVMRDADKSMTAAQIAAACDNGLSSREIAENLLAMKYKRSRYRLVNYCYSHPVPEVNIPGSRKYLDEYIGVKKGGVRKAIVVEIDEHDEIIPDTKREIKIHESNRYYIEKTK